jgi:TIR domain
VPIVPGFKHDLFVSYAHANDEPWGWVSDFVKTLQAELKGKSREFRLWWDPGLRTGENFDSAIGSAISESAVFLSVLSKAYGDSRYCSKEVQEFRQQRHPAFDLTVGTLSRMQAIVIEGDFTKESWPPELRNTSPCPFYSDSVPLFSKPGHLDSSDPWVKRLWKVRDSIWATLDEMQRQKTKGIAVERSYDVSNVGTGQRPTVYLAEVTDDLYHRREGLRMSLAQTDQLRGVTWSDAAAPPTSGLNVLSVHMFGSYPGRPYPGGDTSLARLQLEAAASSNPARRPLVWLARDLDIDKAETDAHKEFLLSLLNRSDIEVLLMDFEDLKDEVGKRMSPSASTAIKKIRQTHFEPIVHIWRQADDPASFEPLKEYLEEKHCGISVFKYAPSKLDTLQSRLAICDGLVLPYSSATKESAEEAMTVAFSKSRREERPIAFAAVELPPQSSEAFNFTHPRVVPVHADRAGGLRDIDVFLSKLEQADV